MLICQRVKLTANQTKMVDESLIEKSLRVTKTYLVETLDRFQKVEAEITVPDIQNIAIAKFFAEIREYYKFDPISKRLVTDRLQSFLNNVEDIAGDFNITKKRNGWWSELYRQKWDV